MSVKQRFFSFFNSWTPNHIVKLVTVIFTAGISPFCVHYGTKAVETTRMRFEEIDREKQRQHQLHMMHAKQHQQVMDRVLKIASAADMKNPAHVFRLGLIATIVEDNKTSYNIKLQQAKEELKEILKKIGPYENLEQKYRDARENERELKEKISVTTVEQNKLKKQLLQLEKSYNKVRWTASAKREQLIKDIKEKSEQLAQYIEAKKQYRERMQQEKREKIRYAGMVQKAKADLKIKVAESDRLRTRMEKQRSRFHNFAHKMLDASKLAVVKIKKLHNMVRELTKSNKDAEEAISSLREKLKQLKSEKTAISLKYDVLEATCKPKTK
jgi:chromosome segregation ATPase